MEKPRSASVPVSRLSKNFLHFLAIAPNALLVIDHAGAMIAINAQMERIFGYTQFEMLGQDMEMLLPERFRNMHVAHREHYFATSRLRPMGIGLQLFGVRKDTTEFPLDISLRPLILGNALHAIAAIRDMTEQKGIP
jgi:PAS domain S-box-containing protein